MPQLLRVAVVVALSLGVTSIPGAAPVSAPASAYIQSLEVDPNEPGRIYAASPGGGLFRTDDGGDHWRDISPTPTTRHFNAVIVVPAVSGLVYAGGEGTGLWVSPDRGDHWVRTAFPGSDVLDIAVDPDEPQRLYVLSPEGIHRTVSGHDAGWTLVFDYRDFIAKTLQVPWPEPEYGVGLTRFQRLTLDPGRPQTLFCGARWEGGYHRSDDGGTTWRHETLGPIFRRADRIQTDPRDPRILLASTHHQGLFKSWNDGRSWVSRSRGLEPQRRTPHYGAVLLSGLAFEPGQPSTMYSGSDYSNWKTIDGGTNWHELGRTLTSEFARSFAVARDAADGNPVVFAGTNIGIYRSRDGGLTWEGCNRGLPARRLITTVRGHHEGTDYEFALTEGVPAVYRRDLSRDGDWLPISWQLYETGQGLRFDAGTGVLELETVQGVRRSLDGGLRWDVDLPRYAERRSENPPLPEPAVSVAPGHRAVRVAIHGAPRPDDALVEPMYQRPPYVYLALVEAGYPENGRAPVWEQAWPGELAGTLSVPESVLTDADELFLYVEVRDFQYGTRTGRAPLNLRDGTIVETGL